MSKPISLSNFKDTLEFLEFLLTSFFDDIPQSLIKKELENYDITRICNCVKDEYEKDSDICGSFYLKHNSKDNGVFEENSYFSFSSNIGLFMLLTDENGHLKECEFFYKVASYPAFYLDVLKHFQSKKDFEIYMRRLEFNKAELKTLEELKSIFSFDKMSFIEVE